MLVFGVVDLKNKFKSLISKYILCEMIRER